ncbi:MAG: outer membrane protein assembly factor BamE [Chthoniobacter sp.]|uniref:outer membrane protein assembly factor BamE domain-containing protein n=1 Tax=Chthoniobacter sp. TaxID=2510640 RepID=UPI0032A935A0
MKRLAPLFALLLFGCASVSSVPQRIALLHVGMTQQEVTGLLGKPRTTNSTGALTVYDYYFTESQVALSYYVIIGRDGRVRSFGPN